MPMQTDVNSVHFNSTVGPTTSLVVNSRARLKGVLVVGIASQTGSVKFLNSSSTGTNICEIDVPSNTNVNSFYVAIPGEGILFDSSMYVTLTQIGGVTIFYG
jgi:hypothetical protein